MERRSEHVSIKLRTSSLDDLGIIHAIRRDAILGVPPVAGLSDLQTWADRRSPEFYADRLAAGNVVIASSEGKNIGWGSCSDEWITGLYVRSSWSLKGVGRTIMSRLETEIAKRWHTFARLESSANAVGFYTRLGYAPVGLPDDDGAVPMKKRVRND
jgi:GNAT superfamily N-acetyltransferase